METAALHWLQGEHVEGTDGLEEKYTGSDLGPDEMTIKDAILKLGEQVTELNTEVTNHLATETAFEHGFDPLAGGFRDPGNPKPGTPFAFFDQWVEILPTDQVVASEYVVP